MDLSLILRGPSTSYRSHFVPRFAPFSHRNPKIFPRNPRCRDHRWRVSFPKNAASFPGELFQPSQISRSSSIFGGEKELSGPQVLVDALPPPVRVASSVVVAAAAIAAGYGLGLRLVGSRAAAVGVAAVLGAAFSAAAYYLNSSASDVASISVHNLVVGCRDPAALKKEDVEAIIKKYGVSRQDESFKADLCDLYCRFVSSVLPPGGENLKGNEAETIIKFKDALGIDDPDAASVHMEIGRRIFRERLETGDREADVEQRRAFQKLIYVSTLVFGEASKFLLPWKRVFKVSDAQVDIAIRDNAQRLYALKLKSVARDIDERQLFDLRKAQLLYKLGDEIAAEMLMEHLRKIVEETVSSALDVLRSRSRVGRETTQVIEEIEKVLVFNDLLVSLTRHPQFDQFAPGVGPVSLVGGQFDVERKMDDIKLLYRAYASELFAKGSVNEELLLALNQLRNVFGLGKREAESIIVDVTSKIYRRRLSQAFSGGELDSAPSKAVFLQNLCDELSFDPQKASEIHEEIYRQKLQQSITDGMLSEDDFASLQRLRVLLCIPKEIIDSAHADICGRLFERVVKNAIASGVEGYDADVRASVRKASHGLRLTTESAMDIASKAVRKVFLTYVQRARGAGNRTEAARELKKMIVFNTLVVTELISDIKGEPTTEFEELAKDAEDQPSKQDEEEDEWESLQTLRKSRPSKELEVKLGKVGQAEITLRDDLPERDRMDLYKTYLLFCLTGEVTVVPFGTQITTKKDNSEYLLLNQLGGILGLTGKEVVDVHRSIAEQAFLKQAEVILADGLLTKAKMEQLNEAQKQVGLPSEFAQKIIKNITTTKMAAAIETAVSQGRIGIQQVRELKEAKIDLDSMISVRLRENLFKKTVEEIFSSGTGVFEDEEVYQKIPADLTIDPMKAKVVVDEVAKSRLSSSLIQAVALLRQRNRDGVVASLNDMLACDKAVPSPPLSWSSREELADLYLAYLKSTPTPSPENCARLQYLFGLSDGTVALLQDSAEHKALPLEDEEEFVF